MTASGAVTKVIQREKRQQRAHDVRTAVTVTADAAFADRRAGEIGVGENKLVPVTHFCDELEQFGTDDGRNSFQHSKNLRSIQPVSRRTVLISIIARCKINFNHHQEQISGDAVTSSRLA